MKQSEEWKKIRNKLRQASMEKNPSLRSVKISAIITEAFRQMDTAPILVGGAAVSFYTDGRYTTSDIDMIAPSGKETQKIMEELGFKKLGMDFINEPLKIYVEFPNEFLGPTEKYDIIKIGDVDIKIISLEDLIVDRLCAFKFWNSSIDGVNAMIMLEQGKADINRLSKRAAEEDVADALIFIEKIQETVIRKKLSRDKAVELLKDRHLRSFR